MEEMDDVVDSNLRHQADCSRPYEYVCSVFSIQLTLCVDGEKHAASSSRQGAMRCGIKFRHLHLANQNSLHRNRRTANVNPYLSLKT